MKIGIETSLVKHKAQLIIQILCRVCIEHTFQSIFVRGSSNCLSADRNTEEWDSPRQIGHYCLLYPTLYFQMKKSETSDITHETT